MENTDNESASQPQTLAKANEIIEWPPLPNIESEHISAMIFTHSSSKAKDSSSDEDRDYERLEHVGDAVLNLALAHISYELYPHIGPAALTSIKIGIASNASLGRISAHYKLSERMSWDPSVRWLDSTQGNKAVESPAPHTKVHADLLEAYIGGVFLDQGYNAVLSWLTLLLTPLINKRYDTYICGLTLKERLILEYGKSIKEWEGARRQLLWKAVLKIGQEHLGQAIGTSRSEARRLVALEALTKIADLGPVDSKADSETLHNALQKYAQKQHLGKPLNWTFTDAGERWISRVMMTNGIVMESEASSRTAAEQMVAERLARKLRAETAWKTRPGALRLAKFTTALPSLLK